MAPVCRNKDYFNKKFAGCVALEMSQRDLMNRNCVIEIFKSVGQQLKVEDCEFEMEYIVRIAVLINQMAAESGSETRLVSARQVLNNEEKVYLFTPIYQQIAIQRLRSSYTSQQVDLFFEILHALLSRKEFNYFLSVGSILQMRKQVQGDLSQNQTRQFIWKMIHNNYFEALESDSQNGKDEVEVTLGVRTLIDLQYYVLQIMRRISNEDKDKLCYICNRITLHGIECVNCEKNLHKRCFQRFQVEQKAGENASCPNCGQFLDEKVQIKEEKCEEEEMRKIGEGNKGNKRELSGRDLRKPKALKI